MKKFALVKLSPMMKGDDMVEIVGIYNNRAYAERAFKELVEGLGSKEGEESWFENVGEYKYVYLKSRGFPRILLGLDSFEFLFKSCVVEFDDGVNAYGCVLKELNAKLSSKK